MKVGCLRLTTIAPETPSKNLNGEDDALFGKQFDKIFANRIIEADEFYKSITPPAISQHEPLLDEWRSAAASCPTPTLRDERIAFSFLKLLRIVCHLRIGDE
jgi:hypothetical protein